MRLVTHDLGNGARALHVNGEQWMDGHAELEVEGIGSLRNRLGPPVDPDPNYRYRASQGAAAPA